MDEDPIGEVQGGCGPLQVKKNLPFYEWSDCDQLLDYFRNTDSLEGPFESSDGFSKLRALLKRIRTIYKLTEPAKNLYQKEKEKWRKARVDLYDNLFLILLGAENGNWDDWRVDSDAVSRNQLERWDQVFKGKFTKEGSLYKHLLDDIHENDDVMLLYYQAEASNKLYRGISGVRDEYFWFYQSMERYRMWLIKPVTAIMKAWKEESKTDCEMEDNISVSASAMENNNKILEAARRKFDTMILRAGNLSWRYKARMYWLLSRFYRLSRNPRIRVLCREIVTQANKVFLDVDKNFADKVKNDNKLLGSYPSLLAYACAKNDLSLVQCMLESKKEFDPHAEYDKVKWENDWKDSWAKALWIAARKGHGPIVNELLQGCSKLYSTTLYLKWNLLQPLHEAVQSGEESVVSAFCNVGSNCHEEDEQCEGSTPLKFATELFRKELDDRKKCQFKRIQSMLLKTPEVLRAVEESQAQRELTVGSANAILVGAALIAGVAYAGWLQPPLGYHPYYQFTEPVPGAQDEPLSYMFVQGHATIRVFAICNSLSFFFAIAAIVAGMETTCFIEELEQMYASGTVKNLRKKLKRTRTLFILAVLFVLIAFSSAAIAILPPIMGYQKDMYITIALGGFVCMAMMFMFSVSKRRVFSTVKESLRKRLCEYKGQDPQGFTCFRP